MQTMSVDEVMPVVKALHADPACAPMMADWFRDRGWDDHADVLQFCRFYSGQGAVDALAHGKTINRHTSTHPHPKAKFVPYHPAVREAVIRECWSRVREEAADYETVDYEVQYHHKATREKLLGTRREDWHRLRHHANWDWNCSARHTVVSPCGTKTQRVHLTLAKVNWEPRGPLALCGGWLTFTVSVWVGRNPFTSHPIVTLFDPALARDPVLHQIPF